MAEGVFYPGEAPPVPIYAGDPALFYGSIQMVTDDVPDDLSAWSDWRATWAAAPGSPHVVPLTVDASQKSVGLIIVSASAVATRQMQTFRRHMIDGLGVWDLQAMNGAVPRTWIRGRTTHREDQTK